MLQRRAAVVVNVCSWIVCAGVLYQVYRRHVHTARRSPARRGSTSRPANPATREIPSTESKAANRKSVRRRTRQDWRDIAVKVGIPCYRQMVEETEILLLSTAAEVEAEFARVLKRLSATRPAGGIQYVGIDAEWLPESGRRLGPQRSNKGTATANSVATTTSTPHPTPTTTTTTITTSTTAIVTPNAPATTSPTTPSKPCAATPRPSVSKVSLLQVSTEDVTLLVRTLSSGITPSLKRFLEDATIIKVGVNCTMDGARLARDFGVDVVGCLELACLLPFARMDPAKGAGMRKLCGSLLGITLPKNPSVRCGDWEANELSGEQLLYAAADSFFGRKLFFALAAKAELGAYALGKTVMEVVDQDKDLARRALARKKKKKRSQNLDKIRLKEQRKLAHYECLSGPHYENCRVVGPDGAFMFTCDSKKIRWYMSRKLAHKISGPEETTTIMLDFQPKGKGNAGSRYYEHGNKNECVVCGSESNMVRHNVIPHVYRKHFPLRIKRHSSHDVLLLCTKCHALCKAQYSSFRSKLRGEHGVSNVKPKAVIDNQKRRVRNAANAVLRDRTRQKLPPERELELRQIVSQYLSLSSVHDLTDDALQVAGDLIYRIDPDPAQHPEALVVKAVMEAGDGDVYRNVAAFSARWRKYFIHVMQPRNLSEHWDVNFCKPNDADLDVSSPKDGEGDNDQDDDNDF